LKYRFISAFDMSSSESTDLPARIVDLDVRDIRFPTCFDEHGSDASHSAPDYSAVYVRLITDNGMTSQIFRIIFVCQKTSL
jgi:hypothetical protein